LLGWGGWCVGSRSGRWLGPGRLWALDGEVATPSSGGEGGYEGLVGEGPGAKGEGCHCCMLFERVLRSRVGIGWWDGMSLYLSNQSMDLLHWRVDLNNVYSEDPHGQCFGPLSPAFRNGFERRSRETSNCTEVYPPLLSKEMGALSFPVVGKPRDSFGDLSLGFYDLCVGELSRALGMDSGYGIRVLGCQ